MDSEARVRTFFGVGVTAAIFWMVALATGFFETWERDWVEALDRLTIVVGAALAFLTTMGAVLALLNIGAIRKFLLGSRVRDFDIVDEAVKGNQWDVIVFLLSKVDVIRFHLESQQLRFAALGVIVTEQSRKLVDEVRSLAGDCGLEVIELGFADQPNSPLPTELQVSDMINRLRSRGYQRLAVDVTGCTKPMSIGAFHAARAADVAVLYTFAAYDEQNRLRTERNPSVHLISKPSTMA